MVVLPALQVQSVEKRRVTSLSNHVFTAERKMLRKMFVVMLVNEIGTSRTCGFCGKDSCEAKIKTSKKLNKVFYSLEDSDCPHVFDWIKVFNKKKTHVPIRLSASV